MKVLICGGRDYSDQDRVFSELDALHAAHHFTWLIHGAARGADSLASDWAASRKVFQISCPANWRTHGLAAGMLRNKAMLEDHKPDLIVAFPGGPGTANMISIARTAGCKIIVIS